MADAPTPAGFGRCYQCAYRDTGTPAICSGCAGETFEGLAVQRCDVCDLPYRPGQSECQNPVCKFDDRYFDRNYSIAMRSGVLRDAIHTYKYDNKTGWALIFARVLVGKLEAERETFSRFDLIVASPSYTGEGSARTWDHTRLVLERAAQIAPEWPFDLEEPAAIIKTANTDPMVQARTWKQRHAVAIGPLRQSLRVPAPDRTSRRRILVYDDVFTDGQTLNEVARAIRILGGARSVCGITLARQPFGRRG